MHSSTKRITDGAMMVAIVGMLLFINRQFAGILEYAMYWILSFPILIYTVKYDWKAALIPACAMMLLALMIALPTTLFYLASALLCGWIYGHGVNRHWSNRTLLMVTGILTLLSYLITMVLFAAVFGYDPNEDILLAQQIAQVLHLGNINIGQIALVFSLLLTVLTAVLQTICVHLIAILTLRRMKLPAPAVKTVAEFHYPKWLGCISICIWLLFYLRNMLKLEGNLLVLVLTLYGIVAVILCSECILDLLTLAARKRQRLFGMLLAFGCIAAMIWEPTRTMICLFGACSILLDVRRTWK